ncbi:uncharacterized protein A4U43_C05F50 [Asparagus officinalis]|uniref:G domain-containing protein n=1 Tax=Asparagus officinalis TaxID=4686 RepID=A0A5P1ERT3_ASPOF|nr:uncharacterized protein A4U43_C05F50 [Asparagus officinalis]
MDYKLAALKVTCRQLRDARKTNSTPPSMSLFGILFQRAWIQGVLVSGSEEGRFLIDDGSDVVELSLANESSPHNWKKGETLEAVGGGLEDLEGGQLAKVASWDLRKWAMVVESDTRMVGMDLIRKWKMGRTWPLGRRGYGWGGDRGGGACRLSGGQWGLGERQRLVLMREEDSSGEEEIEGGKHFRGAYLLIRERVDIAAAVGASGVLLSDQGLPPIVARNMMMKSKSDTVYLPLVARIVQSTNSAVTASSSEGADFLVICNASENCAHVLENAAIQHVKVPVFFSIADSLGRDLLIDSMLKLFDIGAPGVVLSLSSLKLCGDEVLKKIFSTTRMAKRILQEGSQNSRSSEAVAVKETFVEKNGVAGFAKLATKEIQLIESERILLREAVGVIQEAAPMMKEVGLLLDAASRLSEPFLLVIVGEFNSGKSTVINALLGRRYLKEGVIPTTNEITLLCYSEKDFDEQERCQRRPDGQFICYLSSPILKNMNLVDTPGTNVILQRQQRLTEEFIPQADLILFVLSSDRPLTESEVAFLLYVQQWKKRVVFILNKLDIYRNTSELEEATAFIKENTCNLLSVEDIRLYPVSARSALEAKISASNYSKRSYDQLLSNDPRWTTSRFYELEKFLFSFLDGSTENGMERMRLKLETPIGIADRLLSSCVRLVKQDYENASQDLISIKEMVKSVDVCTMKMEQESRSWRKRVVSLIETARTRAIKLLESTLQLSNVDIIATYTFKREGSAPLPVTSAVQNEIINPAITDAQRLLGEYSRWLLSNNAHEGQVFIELFNERWHSLVNKEENLQLENYGLLGKGEEFSTRVMENFSASAAAKLFEQEIREVVLGTFGGLGAAGLSASLLTSVLPTTLEDLLALVFCSVGGLFAISNFPGRRKEAIEKVRKVADGLALEIEEAMEKDLKLASEKLDCFVEAFSKPYQDAAQLKIDRLVKIQDNLAKMERKVQDLKVEIQNLHAS